jgi:hypothetical protein
MDANNPEFIATVREGAKHLTGAPLRQFMAGIARVVGGQRIAAKLFGWSRTTIRKGEHELSTGIDFEDARKTNGRESWEKRIPTLHEDIKAVVEPFLAADPTFRTENTYRRLTSGEVRRRLIAEKGYDESNTPSEESIRERLNSLGFRPRRVLKSKPLKKTPKLTQFSKTSIRQTRLQTPHHELSESL